MNLNFPIKNRRKILALGAEFDTRLGFYFDGKIIFSDNIGELAENEAGYEECAREFVSYCRRQLACPPFWRKLSPAISKPDFIITDSHPLYTSGKVGEKLAKEWGIKHIEVQHHIAHIFSSFGDWMGQRDGAFGSGDSHPKVTVTENCYEFYGIACDGTGYGLDGNIWGGEVFKVNTLICANDASLQNKEEFIHFKNATQRESTRNGIKQINNFSIIDVQRIGHLEEQCLLGGELAVEEPARMLISILSKFLPKDEVFEYMKEYYSKNEFNLLWNQLQQKFNCMVSSSAGRVLDAVSILLGFCGNERKYRHYPVKMLEKNSKYSNFNASLGKGSDPLPAQAGFEGGQTPRMRAANLNGSQMPPQIEKDKSGEYILNTTDLFRYLIENINSDKRQLGKLAQRYIIEGLYEIVKRYDDAKPEPDSLRESDSATYPKIFFSG